MVKEALKQLIDTGDRNLCNFSSQVNKLISIRARMQDQ